MYVCVCILCACLIASSNFQLCRFLYSHTCSVTAPLRTDRGNSSDTDKWAHSGTDSHAGNTAVKAAAAKSTTQKITNTHKHVWIPQACTASRR